MGESMKKQLERISETMEDLNRGPRQVSTREPITLEHRPETAQEARRMKAELVATTYDIDGQLKSRTRFEFNTDIEYHDWRRRALGALFVARAKLAILGPILRELNEAESAAEHEVYLASKEAASQSQPQAPASQVPASSDELKALREERLRLIAERDTLSASTAQNRFASEFVEVARVVLGEQTFNRISARARDRVSIKRA